MRSPLFTICVILYFLLFQNSYQSIGQSIFSEEGKLSITGSPADSHKVHQLIDTAWVRGNAYPDCVLTLLDHSLTLSRQKGYSFGIAKSLQLSGIICSHTGRYEEGITHLRQLIYYCLLTGKHTDLLGLGYNIIGNIYQSQGKYQEAAWYYYQTLRMPKEHLAESTIGLIYTNLSRLTHKLKQPEQAIYYLDRAEQIAARNNNYDLLCIISSNRGMIYADTDQNDSAVFYLRKARRQIREHSHRYDLQDIEYTNLTYLADLWLKEGKTDSVAPCIKRMHEIRAPIIPLYKNKALLTTGKYYLLSGDNKNAERYLRNALDSAQSIHIGNDLPDIHLALANLYTATGKYREALQHKDDYIRLKDSLESREIANNVHHLEVRYRTAEKDKELISQKLKISQHKSDLQEKNLWIMLITSGMILLVIVSIALYKKRQADKRLQLKEIQILRQQQDAMRKEQEIESLKAMMKGEERERERLARELHDGIGGMLTAVKMNLSAARKKHPELAQFAALTEITHMLEDTGSEIRKTAHNLMPDVLVRHRLTEALMIYCENIGADDQLKIDLQFQGDLSTLDKATELLLYRIIQELIQNILKHASATYAVIQLMVHNGQLNLTVEDNGTGFDTNEHNGGFGLQNLRYRVEALQGRLAIMSAKGRSTTIHIEFGLEKLKLTNG